MKRVLGYFVAVLVAASAMALPAAAQSVNDFRITSFDIQYELSRDSENRSVLKTTETITAVFPQTDQNHGLERALPLTYNDHSTNLKITSVTDENDMPRYYTKREGGNVLVLRIGDPDSYVHGQQTYKMTYQQRDVTRFYADTNRDEWYWDTNGVEWQVPIDRLTVSVKLGAGLENRLSVEPFCYVGAAGSTDRCTITENDGSYVVQATNLAAGENVTLAFGFAPETFVPYQPTAAERLEEFRKVAGVVAIGVAAAVFVGMLILYNRRRNRVAETGFIPVEYIPPRNASIQVSSRVITPKGSVFSAQLIDLAVRHYIQIIETRQKSFLRPAEYDLKVVGDLSQLAAEEQEVVSDMFGHLPQQGVRLELKTLRSNAAYTRRMSDNSAKLSKLIVGEYALRQRDSAASRTFYIWAVVVVIISALSLSFWPLPAAAIIAILGWRLRPLTDKGLELRRYVLGLERYIKAAESERLKFHQAPDSAQKIGETIDPDNPGQVVKLYERVLPYAILFGQQKEWSNRLGEYYSAAGSQPDWYAGQGAFNAALFSSAISDFSQSSAYSSGTSSDSGGSSGGGSSGGGGGGGGGGGW